MGNVDGQRPPGVDQQGVGDEATGKRHQRHDHAAVEANLADHITGNGHHRGLVAALNEDGQAQEQGTSAQLGQVPVKIAIEHAGADADDENAGPGPGKEINE